MSEQLTFADFLPSWADHAEQKEVFKDTGQRSAPDDDPRLLAFRSAYLDRYWRERGYHYNIETFSYEWNDHDEPA